MRTALVCIAKDEDLYIEEWISYHLAIGFDKIFVLANEWNYSTDNKRVEVIPFPSFEYALDMQSKAYNYALRILKGSYDWVAFYDVDEFLCLKKHSDVKSFIKEFYPHRPKAIAVNWAFYGDNGLSEVSDSYSLLERFTKRQAEPDKHIKVIVSLKGNHYFSEQPHSTNLEWTDQNLRVGTGPFNENASIDMAQINHYWCKTREEYDKFKMPNGQTWGPNLKREPGDFQNHNHNEVEDTIARDFYRLSER